MELNIYKATDIETLRHRDTARNILEKVITHPDEDKIVLDFSGIKFASKSFLHELLRGLEGRNVTFINTNEEVRAMIEIALDKPKLNLKTEKEIVEIKGLITS